jgi:hypothetical protein
MTISFEDSTFNALGSYILHFILTCFLSELSEVKDESVVISPLL